jgi:hypothetical protein
MVLVASGFIGRYVYTALPRTPAGMEIGALQLESALHRVQAQLDAWLDAHPARWRALAAEMGELPALPGRGWGAVLRQRGVERRYRRRWRRAVGQLDAPLRPQAAELGELLSQRRTLQRQIETLATTRRILAIWHTLHVPLGLVLFTLALLHVVAALYYSRGAL